MSLAVGGFCGLGEAENLTHTAVRSWELSKMLVGQQLGKTRREMRCCFAGMRAWTVQSKPPI